MTFKAAEVADSFINNNELGAGIAATTAWWINKKRNADGNVVGPRPNSTLTGILAIHSAYHLIGANTLMFDAPSTTEGL